MGANQKKYGVSIYEKEDGSIVVEMCDGWRRVARPIETWIGKMFSNRVIDDDDAQHIAELTAKGYTSKELASMYDVSPRTIFRHLNRIKSSEVG